MYVSKKVLAIAAGLVLVAVVLVSLSSELSQANAALQQSRADLNETSAALRAMNEQNISLNSALQQANANVERMNAEVAAADAKVATANIEIEKGNETIADLSDTVTVNQSSIAQLEQANQEWADRNSALTSERDQLKTDKNTLQSQYTTLLAQNGTIHQLRSEETRLRNEISRLEEIRKPLILGQGAMGRSGFLCTGSMEPKITCLDEMTWLADSRPQDITVGTVISFSPDCWDDTPDNNPTAHRVMDIEVRDGVHYYWPKGDNNLEADGCWIPEQHVLGYLVDIEKNVVMENANLRSMVNAARTAYRNALDLYDEGYAKYCGTADVNTCAGMITRGQAQEMSRLWDLANRAYNHFYCWYQSALKSERPGHIPYSC